MDCIQAAVIAIADAVRPTSASAVAALHDAEIQVGAGTDVVIGYNTIARPIGAGVFEPSLGLKLRPDIAARTMSGSSLIVAVNGLLLKRLQRPRAPAAEPTAGAGRPGTTSRTGRSDGVT